MGTSDASRAKRERGNLIRALDQLPDTHFTPLRRAPKISRLVRVAGQSQSQIDTLSHAQRRTTRTTPALFSDLPDPRAARGIRHQLRDIVRIAVLAVICKADTFPRIHAFSVLKYDWLKPFLELPNGIPNQDTFKRVFEILKPSAWQSRFLLHKGCALVPPGNPLPTCAERPCFHSRFASCPCHARSFSAHATQGHSVPMPRKA